MGGSTFPHTLAADAEDRGGGAPGGADTAAQKVEIDLLDSDLPDVVHEKRKHVSLVLRAQAFAQLCPQPLAVVVTYVLHMYSGAV